MAPKLSVILPNYNHGRYLRQTLEGLVSQELAPDEILIVDDGSTDDSRAIIDEFASRHASIHPTYFPTNRGPNVAVDHLLAQARGEYLFPIGADDGVLPGFFRKAIDLLDRHPQAALFAGLHRRIGASGEDLGVIPRGVIRSRAGFVPPDEARRRMAWHGPWIAGNAVIYRRQALLDAGWFRRELGPYCDGFIQEVLAMRHGACFLPEVLTVWRQTAGNYSALQGAIPAVQRRMFETALTLMQTDYADVYSPQMREIFKQRIACQVKICENNARKAIQNGWGGVRLAAENLLLTLGRKSAYWRLSSPREWPHGLAYILRSYWVTWNLPNGVWSGK